MPTVSQWRRRNRRKARKIVRRKRKSPQLKVYRFPFATEPAYVYTTLVGSGGADNTVSGYTIGAVNSLGTGVAIHAKSGFPNFYDWGQSYQFQMADMRNNDAWRALYDQYRIDGVTITIQSLQNTASMGSVMLTPTCYISTDYDDATIPNSSDQIIGRPGFKMFKFGNGNRTSFTFKCKPKIANMVYGEVANAAAVGYGTYSGWLDCALKTVPHYGVKIFMTDVYAGVDVDGSPRTTTAFKIDVKYNVAFRTPLNAC